MDMSFRPSPHPRQGLAAPIVKGILVTERRPRRGLPIRLNNQGRRFNVRDIPGEL